MVGVIDYGVGNLFSLVSSLAAVGAECVVSSDEKTLAGCDRLVLPGVGAFGAAMDRLGALGLDKFVVSYARGGGKLLGICLGMQLLFERSFEFGEHRGLGLIGGDVLPLSEALKARGCELKVPAIGWNELVVRQNGRLTSTIKKGDYAYYVHSFYAPVGEYTAASSDYGVPVTGIAVCGNAAGCQFHPEKSGSVGLGILRSFVSEGI